MSRLKQATNSLHQGLEALPRMRRLAEPTLTREEYRDLLRHFYRATWSCEHHLLQRAALWESRGLDWSTRLGKTAWLEEDLRQLDSACQVEPLGARGDSSRPATLSAAVLADLEDEPLASPFRGQGFGAAAGCLYVLEGATLGSRVILGLLGRARERPAEGATRFFAGYGPQTGERWARLGGELQDHLGQDEAALKQALVAAAETYAFFRSVFGNP